MRLARLTMLCLLTSLALVACASEPATWTYAPAPSKTPAPSGSAEASAEASAPASGNIYISATNILFDQTAVDVPADVPFKIDFDNKDAAVPHNIIIHTGEASGPVVFTGETFNGVALKVYDVPALAAGGYTYICSIHPTTMIGVMTAK
jgi:plastocyanin